MLDITFSKLMCMKFLSKKASSVQHRSTSQKSYAMRRMSIAIERAIAAGSARDKERAARWAAAWGLVLGITARATSAKRRQQPERAMHQQGAQG